MLMRRLTKAQVSGLPSDKSAENLHQLQVLGTDDAEEIVETARPAPRDTRTL
jgi:hypothetical protein